MKYYISRNKYYKQKDGISTKISENEYQQTKFKFILKNFIRDTFKNWLYTKNIMIETEKFYQKNKLELRLFKIEIVKGKIISIDNEFLKNLRSRIYYIRSVSIYKMIKYFLLKMNLSSSFNLYITTKDSPVTLKYPILSYARPNSDKKTILIPDWTFYNAYKSKIKSNWYEQSKYIINSCQPILKKDKKNIIFFQGADTSKSQPNNNKTDIRRNLKIVLKNHNNIKILIDKEPKSSVSDWCKYKYLLDLPGSKPWSVRFKELLLTKSLIIKFDVEDYWINFYSVLFKPNEDYKQIIIEEAFNPDKKLSSAKKAGNKLIKLIEDINDKEFDNITQSAYKKIKMLNNHMIQFYYKKLFNQYYETFYN